MSYSPQAYAKAFLAALSGIPKAHEMALIANFLKSIGRHGDSRLFYKIVEQIEMLTVKKEGGQVVVVESARVLSLHQKKELMRHFSKKDIIREKIRPELVAGVRININGEKELDLSFKGVMERILA